MAPLATYAFACALVLDDRVGGDGDRALALARRSATTMEIFPARE